MRYSWLDDYLMDKPAVTKDFKIEWNWIRYFIGGKMFAAVLLDKESKPYYINLKLEPLEGDFWRTQYEDIVPGYYSNKQHWNSIKPDGTVPDELLKYPYQMSGGQQQRVAAARAMVTNPAMVLADEPTGALDSNSSRMLLTMLTELNEQLAATILMVTHDAFSASYCHRILFIKDGQVFNELHRGTDTRKDFFAKILEVVSVLGGEQNDLI